MGIPNILLIITDSQGPNVLGKAGAGQILTPNIDALAKKGVNFTRAYNTCPLCTPARAGLFSGLYPQTAGAWSNDLSLGTNVPHLGRWFEREGYSTGYIGKWHLDGTDYFGTGICPEGWDPNYWFDGRNYLETLSPEERELWRSGLRTPEAIHQHGITREWTWAGGITDRGRQFIENCTIDDPEKPWLLVVSYDEPHGPSVCPPPFCDMYTDFSFPLPPNGADPMVNKPVHHREWASQEPFSREKMRQALYFGAGSFVDDEIGRVIQTAEEQAPDNTVIIYTTDHGHYLGAHRLDGKGPALYEEVIRVPLIITGPGIPEGKKCTSLISHLDILPTLLTMAGCPVPHILDGIDQQAVLKDPGIELRENVYTGFHRFSITHDSWYGFIPIRTVVSSQHKLTINLNQTDELYDLKNDPGELINLIDDEKYTDIRGNLHAHLLNEMDRTRDPFRGPAWADRPWNTGVIPPGMGGYRRPRPRDGFLPVPYNYNTGMPAVSSGHDQV